MTGVPIRLASTGSTVKTERAVADAAPATASTPVPMLADGRMGGSEESTVSELG